jgi:hypothetical protein
MTANTALRRPALARAAAGLTAFRTAAAWPNFSVKALAALAGSGKGMWGSNSASTVRRLHDEWSR